METIKSNIAESTRKSILLKPVKRWDRQHEILQAGQGLHRPGIAQVAWLGTAEGKITFQAQWKSFTLGEIQYIILNTFNNIIYQ